ncbi:Mrp/NBP35 family ATP-binding protein [Pseudoroseicyclus tamaricis]|uniref:Iron-sulfur cluster carrier protein n=2 Tax=Pseudoroseicyclus tamaricis TaxID=2705421 RepID=A0A6B2K1T9_9RHOB|nr:Mrp/NBP35 family ATP-binding protein [Pseudoroseicyclus tamaricis]NDV00356.1 P-loop NTPase [Pseudoroseicyclus tamaricis]
MNEVREVLRRLELPDGGDLVSRDMLRALSVEGGRVRFVIEAPNPEVARHMEGLRRAAEGSVQALDWVESASVALTAHSGGSSGGAPPRAPQGAPQSAPKGPGAGEAPPQIRIGGHPTPQQGGPQPVPGIKRILAVGSGKGGVGKSTVAANLAVALAKEGRKVGLLDADIYGPSQPRMMGVSERASSKDGKIIDPAHAHGVTMMSIGLMLEPEKAVIWRGPMLMGAMQQLLGQVAWGELDVLLIDLPPGTGDVQLSLAQRTALSGAIVVCTPQDVALIDAVKAIDMFRTLKVPVLGLIENMSLYICPNCGHEAHIFGHGGVAKEAERHGLPLLGALPIDLDTRLGGDSGTPVATGEGVMSDAYAKIARGLIGGGMA